MTLSDPITADPVDPANPAEIDVLAAERIAWLDGFADPDEVRLALDELRWAWWWPSTLHTPGDHVGVMSPRRQSETTLEWWFTEPLRSLAATFVERLHRRFGIDPRHLEPWQATRYGPGGRFDPHDDVGLYADDPAGDRAFTVILYLEEPDGGGATAFPCHDLAVAPQPGRLLVWANLFDDGSTDRTMRHAGLPVTHGRKTILTTWVRQHPYRRTTGGPR